MSRVGYAPIPIPQGVTVEKTGDTLVVSGSKGSLSISLPERIDVKTENNQIKILRKNEQKQVKSLHGLIRSLVYNMVLGVSQGWSKELELVGVGFRVQGGANKITLSVGYSHPVEVIAPEGIQFEVSDNTKIKVSGIDKNLVGQIAANIKQIRKPDVYKGKGVRYQGEYIRKKAGKAGKIGAVAGK